MMMNEHFLLRLHFSKSIELFLNQFYDSLSLSTFDMSCAAAAASVSDARVSLSVNKLELSMLYFAEFNFI
jgi:hypothetical protein